VIIVEKKDRTTYVVRYSYVDNSYWDDGNRTTWGETSFTSIDDAISFCREIVRTNCVTTTSHTTDETKSFPAWSDSITVYKHIMVELSDEERARFKCAGISS